MQRDLSYICTTALISQRKKNYFVVIRPLRLVTKSEVRNIFFFKKSLFSKKLKHLQQTSKEL